MPLDNNATYLAEAKTEYTKQLVQILRPNIYQGIKSIYEDAKTACEQRNTPSDMLLVFQDLLSRIPKWSQEIIDNEFKRIEDGSQCDWMEDLITAVFISHTKVLAMSRHGKHSKKINIKIPKPSHFMHLCYIESAREIWRDPYLFSEKVPQYQYQKNLRDTEQIISDAIHETIRKQLPVKNILREYLNDSSDDDHQSHESAEHSKKQLKKMVKSQVETTLSKLDAEDSDALITSGSDSDDEADSKTLIKKLVKREIKKVIAAEEQYEKGVESDAPTDPDVAEMSDLEIDEIDYGSTEEPLKGSDLTCTPEELPKLETKTDTSSALLSPEETQIEASSIPVDLDNTKESVAPVDNQNVYSSGETKNEEHIKASNPTEPETPQDSLDNIKEITIGSKVIDGIKELLNIGGVQKLDEKGNQRLPKQVIDVLPAAPPAAPPTATTPPAAPPTAPLTATATLTIQNIDDIELDMDYNYEKSDAECSDVDLEELNVSSEGPSAAGGFTFF